MRWVRRIVLTVVLVMAAAVAIGFLSYDFRDYARITAMDYKAVVVDEEDHGGSVIITERITFDIHAASKDNLFWELWRDLPEEYIDGVKVEYNVIYVKQIMDDGTELIYEESPKLYWYDSDYTGEYNDYGPGKWYHSEGPYDGYYNFECVLFYVDGLYRETVVFEIQYEMTNASLRYNDSSELYLAMYSGEATEYLRYFKGQILFPLDIMPDEGNYDAYTYGTNAHEFDFLESDTLNPGYHTFMFELQEADLKFRSYNEYIEFALIAHGDDKHIFTQHAPDNYYSDEDMLPYINEAQSEFEQLPQLARSRKIILLTFAVILSLGVFALAILINRRSKKKNIFYKPSQEIEYFRDIPSELDASFARKIVFCKHRNNEDIGDGYAAAMLSLVYKGYIELLKIKESGNMTDKNIKIKVLFQNRAAETAEQPPMETKSLPRLTPIEERYMNLIIRHCGGNELSLKDFQDKISRDYQNTDTFVHSVKTAIQRFGITEGYFQRSAYKAPKNSMRNWGVFFIICGILIMLIGNLFIYRSRLDLAFGAFFILGFSFIAAAIYLIVVSRRYILLTQFGEDEYAKWRGLYNFLKSETLMKEREVLEVVIWEQYLIYATAFGISEKVIKALEIRCPEMVINTTPTLYSMHFSSRAFRYSSRSFSRATISASHTARSGGHGGFGGGGRGGGGGGGGH